MDFTKVDILSPAVGTLVANQYSNAQGLTDGFFNDFSQLVFRTNGTTLRLNQALTDYLWLEIVLGTRNAQNTAGAFVHVYNIASALTPSYTANPAFTQNGYQSEATVRIPYIGTIEEIGFEASGAAIGADFSMVVKSIKVVKNSDNLTVKDAYAAARATFTNCAPLVYDPTLKCFAGDVPFNTTINANLAFLALAVGSEIGILRVETVGQDGQTVICTASPDGVLAGVGVPKVKYTYRADDLTVYPTGVTIANTIGGRTAKVRVYLELGSFLDQNVSAFGVNAQPAGTPPSLYNPLNVLIGLTGWIYAAAGVAQGFPTIPVGSIDFTAATVPAINATNINVVNLNVSGTSVFNDVKITRTGVPGGNGSIFYQDVGGYVAPGAIAKFAYRPDFGASGALGLGVAPLNTGTLVNLDGSQSGAGGATARLGISLFVRPTSTGDTGLTGYHTDLNAANSAYTLPFITHFNASQTNAAAPATITLVKGFNANNSIAKGTTNIGFYSDINNATTTYQLYLAGTAPNYIASELVVGNSSVSAGGSILALYMGNAPLTGTTDRIAITIRNTSTSAIVSNNIGIQTIGIGTPAAAITLANLSHYWAQSSTLGAGSAITSVYGFRASNAIAVGSNNYGFWSDIATAPNTFAVAATGTAISYFGGPVQVLSVISANVDVLVRLGNAATHPSANTGVYGIHHSWKSPATATVGMWGNFTVLATTAAVYNTAEIAHYKAATTTLGAGSTATSIFGFYAVNAAMAVASNLSVGFYSDINLATNTYALYLAGTGRNALIGRTIIGGATDYTDSQLVSVFPTAVSGTSIAMRVQSSVSATATSSYGYFMYGATAANSQTIYGFTAYQNDNAGSFTADQAFGFYARNAFVSAVAIGYGFYSDISNASNKYQLYMGGTAVSRFGGSVGYFTDPASNTILHANAAGISGASSTMYYASGIFPSTVTTGAVAFQANIQTAASAVTYAEMTGFRVDTWVKGATSAVTVATGFRVEDSFAIGTTSYGFLSNINDVQTAFTAKYGYYAAGSSRNYMTKLGLGSLALSNWTADDRLLSLYGLVNTTGVTNIYGIFGALVIGNNTTAAAHGYLSYLETQAAAFTITDVAGFTALQLVKGAGSTVTNLYGFRAGSALGGSATNTYGFRSDLASASNTYQFYASGTALNFFKGGMIFDTTAAPTVAAGQVGFGATVASTVGLAGGASAPPATPLGYLIANVAGTQVKIPYYNN